MDELKKHYLRLQGLPLPSFPKVQHLLIGADNFHLITPTKRVSLGPQGAPIALQLVQIQDLTPHPSVHPREPGFPLAGNYRFLAGKMY